MRGHTQKDSWPRVAFGDVVKLYKGRSADPVADGIERYVAIEHIDPEDLRIQRWGLVKDGTTFTRRFEPGQVLFVKRRAYQRKVAVADFAGVCSGDIYVLEPKDDHLLPELLPFICQTDAFFAHAVNTSAGSLSPRTNWKRLAQYEFALPPLSEQRRIARVLQKIEKNLNAHLETYEKADKLWRALSLTEFGVGKDDSGENLSKHYLIVGGQVDPKEEIYSGLPLIAPNHIEGGTGKLLRLETALDQNAISGKYHFDEGAVLYSKIRPKLVKAVISPCEGLCSADMYPLLPKNSLRREYLLEILLSVRFTQFAVSWSMRTGMPKLNRNHLSRYKCRVPSVAEQDRYLEFALKVRATKEILVNRVDGVTQLKKSMIQEVMGA